MDLTADRPPFEAEDPPDLSSQANILKHVKRVATQIEEGKLRYVDAHYIEELNKIEGEFDYEIFLGRTSEEDLEEEEKEYLFDEFGNFETVKAFAGTTPYISTVYSALILYYLNKGKVSNAESLLEEADADWPDNFPLRDYFASRVKLAGTSLVEDIDYTTVVEQARSAYREIEPHYLTSANFANAVLQAFEHATQFTTDDSDELPSEQQLLREAKNSIEEATTLRTNNASLLALMARIYALCGEERDNTEENFDDASKAIRRAIKIKNEAADIDSTEAREYDQIRREIDLRRRTAELQNVVSDAETKAGEVEKKLGNVVERYQRNTLSFIGFFTALITLAITSTQLIGQLDTTTQSTAALIILEGGILLVAFSGLGILLPVFSDEKSLLVRPLALGVLGLLTCGFGYHLM